MDQNMIFTFFDIPMINISSALLLHPCRGSNITQDVQKKSKKSWNMFSPFLNILGDVRPSARVQQQRT
jgi:hypothetical protein